MSSFADVVLPSGQAPAFTYGHAIADLAPGDMVRVPFGKRTSLALVISTHDRTPSFPVREIQGKALEDPFFPAALADLATWMADYYLCPLGTAAGPLWACAGPSSLVALGLGKHKARTREGTGKAIVQPGEAVSLRPTSGQEMVAGAVSDSVRSGGFKPFLLHGVTGSGKTVAYLLAARTALALGRQVLILVPEIGLTPQTVRRTADFLGEPVAVLHSQLSDTQRAEAFLALRSGKVRVALGPRSALFAPLASPGLIVVDEEHDGSYKQSGDSPRYHGRDAAVWLARRHGIPVVLGSATPSLESWNNALVGRYSLLSLAERATGANLPAIAIDDLRRSRKDSGGSISGLLRQELTETLERGGKAVVLHNRRGWAPRASCLDCGAPVECPRCPGLPLTWHKDRNRLACHHCGHVQPPPRTCPACGSEELEPRGYAIQRVEGELHRLFPGIDVVRLDRDVAAKAGAHEKALDAFRSGGRILLGTQMVAKGHDIAEVTLVGVTDADIGSQTPDFRASERSFQLLCQVAGRAGRAGEPGKVVLQSRRPEDPVLADVVANDYAGFAARELDTRRILSLPPFSRLVLLETSGPDPDALEAWTEGLARRIRTRSKGHPFQIAGPLPAPIPVVGNRHRFHLLCKAPPEASARLRQFLSEELASAKAPDGVRAFADVDPLDLL